MMCILRLIFRRKIRFVKDDKQIVTINQNIEGEASAYPFIRIADRYIGIRSLEVYGTIRYIAYKKMHR